MTNFFISDTHFYHKRVIEYDNRPFNSVLEMNQFLISNWNQAVNKNDHVYILGDFAMCNVDMACGILDRLAGLKYLIYGNHDRKLINKDKFKVYFNEIHPCCILSDGGKNLFLCHYPLRSWPKIRSGSIHLYGHVHNIEPNPFVYPQSVNVGCMLWKYKPVTIMEILSEIHGKA